MAACSEFGINLSLEMKSDRLCNCSPPCGIGIGIASIHQSYMASCGRGLHYTFIAVVLENILIHGGRMSNCHLHAGLHAEMSRGVR